jgi:hypothetical protein
MKDVILRWGIFRSAKRCQRCILGLMYSASLKLESQNLTQCSVYIVQSTTVGGQGLSVEFWDSSFELAEYSKP